MCMIGDQLGGFGQAISYLRTSCVRRERVDYYKPALQDQNNEILVVVRNLSSSAK